MKMLNLLISSKNKKSFDSFFYVFNKNLPILNTTYIKKKTIKKLKKKVITILKSPHVNKTAQEQFEIKYFRQQIQICTLNLFKFLIFIKKLKTFIFPDVNINIKLVLNKKKFNLALKKKVTVDNYYFNLFMYSNFNKIQNNLINKTILFKNLNKKLTLINDSQKILKLFDAYGKILV